MKKISKEMRKMLIGRLTVQERYAHARENISWLREHQAESPRLVATFIAEMKIEAELGYVGSLSLNKYRKSQGLPYNK